MFVILSAPRAPQPCAYPQNYRGSRDCSRNIRHTAQPLPEKTSDTSNAGLRPSCSQGSIGSDNRVSHPYGAVVSHTGCESRSAYLSSDAPRVDSESRVTNSGLAVRGRQTGTAGANGSHDFLNGSHDFLKDETYLLPPSRVT